MKYFKLITLIALFQKANAIKLDSNTEAEAYPAPWDSI